MPVARPSWRKPAGIFLILFLIATWAVVVVAGFDYVRRAPWPAHAVYFLAAGLIWVIPLKPLLKWMETGKWR